jgi:SAM-dependent methyltransferase
MRKVFGIVKCENVDCERSKKKILNIPAGNGLLSEKLSELGFQVKSADINGEKPYFVNANLEKKLPFLNESFDYTICLEGLEHVISPTQTIVEIIRVTKMGGSIIISIPNIQNIFSRLCFLFSGELYQFKAKNFRILKQGYPPLDRLHISPLTYYQLLYLFKQNGCEIDVVEGDKYKRKALIPIYGIIITINYLLSLLSRKNKLDIYKFSFSKKLLLSRSLILKFIKITPNSN